MAAESQGERETVDLGDPERRVGTCGSVVYLRKWKGLVFLAGCPLGTRPVAARRSLRTSCMNPNRHQH